MARGALHGLPCGAALRMGGSSAWATDSRMLVVRAFDTCDTFCDSAWTPGGFGSGPRAEGPEVRAAGIARSPRAWSSRLTTCAPRKPRRVVACARAQRSSSWSSRCRPECRGGADVRAAWIFALAFVALRCRRAASRLDGRSGRAVGAPIPRRAGMWARPLAGLIARATLWLPGGRAATRVANRVRGGVGRWPRHSGLLRVRNKSSA